MSCRTVYWHCLAGDRNIKTYSINGIWPFFKQGQTLWASCTVNPPVFGFENCMYVFVHNGITTYSHCRQAQNGWLQIPGAGGYAGKKWNCSGASNGDHGRMGMVCVSWCDPTPP